MKETKAENQTIEELVKSYYDQASIVKDQLNDALSKVEKGVVPSKKEISDCSDSLGELSIRYEAIVANASESLSDDEMPAVGSSVEIYAEAINNSAINKIAEDFQHFMVIINKFVNVHSDKESYESAFEPFREEAKKMLDMLAKAIEGKSNFDIPDVSSQELFVKVVETDDLDNDEGLDLLEQVSEFYPVRIQTGLSRGQYHIDQVADLPDFADVLRKGHVSDSSIKKTSENDSKSNEQSTDALEEKEKDKSTSDFVSALRENDMIMPLDNRFGLLSAEKSPSEEKKVSAKDFKNDIRTGNQKAASDIIGEVLSANAITEKLMKIRHPMIPENVLNINMAMLHKKGYLRKYRLIPGGEFYCGTKRLVKALASNDASKFVGQRQMKNGDGSEEIEDRSSSAAARIAMADLYADCVSSYVINGVPRHTSANRLQTESVVMKVYPTDNEDEANLIVISFWTEDTECDQFLEMLKELCNSKIKRFIVASLNEKTAQKFRKVLVDFIDVGEADVYLYSFEDSKYYDYESENEIEVEDVWDMHLPSEEEEDAAEDNDEDTVEEEKDKSNEDSEISDIEEKADKEEEENKDDPQETAKPEEKKQEKITSVKETVTKTAKISTQPSLGTVSEDFYGTIHRFCKEGRFYCATAYAKARSIKNSALTDVYDRIAYALNDPMRHCTYASDNVFNLIPNEKSYFLNALMVSIGMRTFFSDQVRYDYNITPFYSAIKDNAVISDYPALGNVMYTLLEFKNARKKGMDVYADYRAKSHAELESDIKAVEREAKMFYDSTIAAKKSEKASQRRFLETKKLLFDINGEIGTWMKTVADGDIDIQPLVVEFLQEKFIKEGNTLAEDTIDADMLWEYIMVYWDKAGEKMMMKLRADLMSHLRSNIVKTTTKAVQILVKWCVLVDELNNQAEDEGTVEYKKVRKTLLENIEQAIADIDKDSKVKGISEEDAAGLAVVAYTLRELKACIDGSFVEKNRLYFYVPFLTTDDVLLDDTYYPDLETRSANVEALSPEYRILEHAGKKGTKLRDRLKEIVDEQGDDYGEARLICEYLIAKGDSEGIEDILSDINAGEEYVKETADIRKEDFIGELELAQSFGQIDNSDANEDKKERILQIIDAWYEWASESSNYGFFNKVMTCYLQEIRNQAKAREKDLLEQLESFKQTTIKGLSAEGKEKRVQKIRNMIEQQNYTVAEDMLARADQAEDDQDDIVEENFLNDFLENYDDYYKPVATHRMTFANLVSSRTRNKEERGAKKLADNWLTGGGSLGKDRLSVLLSCFGFKLEQGSIKVQNPIGKFENFFVKTMSETGGKRANYTHPIAAFGSGASQEGFRVVCVNGGYDADGLIDVMKQIGNARHTLILMDYALPLSERRRLARKSKEALGEKVFAVVDRAVMMYMLKNFDETKANRMLMSLIMPFGYYQPYVWKSSDVMPPEIFRGRKLELEKIESATGVNIVYGGRQLGKSALLKKAKADIDRNENGDRAVLVEIKDLDYKEAAKKVGHALFDEKVLTTDITTTDWDEIARAVKKRLQATNAPIPYLLLLLDEADAFIESCEAVNYKPLDALKDIQSVGAGRFKFVVAGLRNIVRFKREAALGNNSVLTHLDSMTVKPFKAREARELMEIPLHYLGLKFPKEKEALITLILATTNYFPGLIQLYCAKLLEAMRKKDYAGYNEVDTPVYEVSEDHIKKVLADPDFMQQIREKFVITLKLDEDNYYYLIALIMAYLYHNNGYNDGYSAEDIKNAGKELDIEKIGGLETEKLNAFMEELKELNVLRNTDDTHYLFTRFTFFQMMGTRGEVDDKLVEYMEV